MSTFLPFIIAIVLIAGLSWIRRGNGGTFGQAIRNSDWHAWRMAVDDLERKLSELRAAEPKR